MPAPPAGPARRSSRTRGPGNAGPRAGRAGWSPRSTTTRDRWARAASRAGSSPSSRTRRPHAHRPRPSARAAASTTSRRTYLREEPLAVGSHTRRATDRVRITVLGKSPAWQDVDGACSGYLVEAGGVRLLLDCGPGVFAKLRRFADYAAID